MLPVPAVVVAVWRGSAEEEEEGMVVVKVVVVVVVVGGGGRWMILVRKIGVLVRSTAKAIFARKQKDSVSGAMAAVELDAL